MKIIRAVLVVTGFSLALSVGAAESDLAACADHFPGGSTANTPKGAQPAASNVHICTRSGDVSFFALEYSPRRYAPVWVSYRITDRFGEDGCASMTRDRMKCHFSKEDVETCVKKKAGSDPFHADPILTEMNIRRLGTGDFSGTGHDRGHMAPNNAFSWHACGAYKTFTMANMTAQWGSLNQRLWASLEAQMLFWGVKDGPVIVTTGPVWRRFPSERFQSIQTGAVKTDSFAKPTEFVTKLKGGEMSKKIPRPTGFYMIAVRPGENGQPDRAIAFLVPHTKQEKLSHWQFVSTVRLIEETSGLHFGLADQLKDWPDVPWWTATERKIPSGWDIRRGCKEQQPVIGWKADQPLAERIKICQSSDP